MSAEFLQSKQNMSFILKSPANFQAGIFNHNISNYLNYFHLFVTHFNTIPHVISEERLDCRKAQTWFNQTYSSHIRDTHFCKRHIWENKVAELAEVFYLLYDDLLVFFDVEDDVVRFLFRKTETKKLEAIISQLAKFRKRKTKAQVSLLVSAIHGLSTREFLINKPKLKLQDNYNDDFTSIHETILKRLNKRNDKGLVLLHGKPGTGKTSYIRYLLSSVKKPVIFLPPNMADAISNPALLAFFTQNSNSILVIEDAENIILDRERRGDSPVSALLNITDGLLSDCLNIQLICSFNTDISKIDSALLRKGRLIAKYEFKELEIPKAQALSKKLGFDSPVAVPMTLTEIYNQKEFDYQAKKNNFIGFKTLNPN